MKTIGTVCLKVVDVIGKICEYICAALAMIITLLVFIQVILRALNMPLFGIEELLTFPTIWIYFLGGACASLSCWAGQRESAFWAVSWPLLSPASSPS